MKLLAVVVSIIAAITANDQNFPDDGPEDSAQQAQQLNDSPMFAADGHAVQTEHQNLNEISEEEFDSYYWNSAAQRAQEKSCADAGGECMNKKSIIMKCNANINKKLKCENKKQVCCISACPDGFFMENGSSKCFRLFTDTPRNWADSSSKCTSEGLQLAHPTNPVWVRSYLVSINGGSNYKYAWLGAQGDGSQFKWQQGNQVISNNSPLWYPNRPGSLVTSNYCLMLLSDSSNTATNPTNPYYPYSCSQAGTKWYALCEVM